MTTDDSALDTLHVGVLLYDGVEPLDAIGPAQVFWSLETARPFVPAFRPIALHLVAESNEPVRAGHGLVIHPTVAYADCPPLDIVIVPGGTGGEESNDTAKVGRRFQYDHPPTTAFVKQQSAGALVTSSVCTGTFILAGAGLMAGHRGNTHWAARDEFVQLMADRGEAFELVVARVVDDGPIVTAGGVSSGIELALHLVDRVLGTACRDAASAIIERETPGVEATV